MDGVPPGGDPAAADQGLERLRAILRGAPDPLGPALRDTIRRFSIPLEPFEDLIEGMRMDLRKDRYSSFDELRLYCYRAASTVGLICIEIFGNEGPAAHGPAIDLGIAMQLVNVLRDVPEDLARGRIYLPGDDMAVFGYGEEDLRSHLVNDPFRALMAFEAARARDHFSRALALLPLIHAESRRCPALLASFYLAILDRIERAGYDVFRRRPRLPIARKLALAGAQLFGGPRFQRAATVRG